MIDRHDNHVVLADHAGAIHPTPVTRATEEATAMQPEEHQAVRTLAAIDRRPNIEILTVFAHRDRWRRKQVFFKLPTFRGHKRIEPALLFRGRHYLFALH